jgi:hypothetical protein
MSTSATPLWSVLLLAPLVVFLSTVVGVYDRDRKSLRRATLDELPAILNVAGFYAVVVWLRSLCCSAAGSTTVRYSHS